VHSLPKMSDVDSILTDSKLVTLFKRRILAYNGATERLELHVMPCAFRALITPSTLVKHPGFLCPSSEGAWGARRYSVAMR